MRTRFPFRQATGLYVHSSPPTGVPVHDSVVRQWLRGGEISRLKELLLEGEGASLIGEYSPDVTARNFLRALPRILNRIEEAHEAAASGDVDRVAQAIKRERSVRVELSKDHSGLSLLHKAVIHGHRDLQIWLVENYPDLVHLLDREKRSPLHYAGSSPDGESVWKLLTTFGADSNVVDAAGYTPAYYMLHPRRARPPQPKGGLSGIKQEKGLVVKPANIRIWIHDRDLGRLQKVVWEGYGQRLLKETSTQPKVRRFLQAVPYILGSIRDVHKAAIENDIETLKRRSEDPIPVDILLSKDVNGLNPLHKAAGIGQKEAVEEILKRAPEAANAQDSFGRTPLHYAAGLRNPEMYQALVEAGATDHLPDKKGNTPSHYRSKPSELEGAKLLSVIPEAPRTAHIFPPSWDWKLLHSGGPQLKSQMSTETITLDSTADDITDTANETEEISRDEVVEESRPEVSEDEGMGSENAQSVEDSTSPQNGENIDMEDDPGEKFGQTITLSNPVFLSGIRVGPDEDEAKQAEEENEPETSNNAQSDEISQSQDDDQPEENTTDKGKEPDVLNIDLEPKVENEKTDIHQNDQTENSNENEINPNSNEQTDDNFIQPVGIVDDQFNKTDETYNNRENDGRTSRTQSGRKSLKARVQKLMWLGRSQSSLQGRDDDFAPQEENLSSKPSSALSRDANIKNENIEEEVRIVSPKPNSEADEEQTGNNETERQEELPEESEPLIPSQDIDLENGNLEDVTEPETIEFQDDSLNGTEEECEQPEERTEIEADDKAEEARDDESNNESSETPSKTTISGTRRTEAERVVAAGDMEAMAEMVLAGEGEALLDLTSDNPDVQLFINNVPQYMAKIERVHKSSREGDLRGVRTSLDRRKYAVAKDNSTSLKPTPLHVAVLFGRTSVLRYLAGRFPETMHAQDSAGRTPLHYAATLPDNGHFYSLLITLGADKAILDKSGKTAEYYLKNKEDLTREMLLAEYQDRPVPIDTSGLNFNRYSDKGGELLREGYPIFKAEEGQYLAASLGEPLIKGLTEVAQLRPPNPIIHLANFLLAFNKSEDLIEPLQRGIRSIEGTPESRGPKEDENGNQMEGDEIEPETEEDETGDNNNKRKDEDEEVVEGVDEDDEITSSPEPEENSFKQVNRDEHGQSMLHFAAARSQGRNAMFQLLQEMDSNPGLRDSLYRTARDIAEQSDIQENIRGIDRYVVALAARGEENRLRELLIEGYDHILDAEDSGNILEIAEGREQTSVLKFLKGITAFEENREKLHRAIRFGSLAQVQEIFKKSGSKKMLAVAKNNQGRCSLHVAVLAQHESTVEHIANKYPATLQIGDNLMRTPLHYAMALEKVESLSRILIAAGAQRVLKDLKGRQASYYFMNKTDIKQLQDEEEALRV
ncbi:uncharacterized protein [Halyomorpha halys]|uniref:uncharacterized protein isoform X2 n=1 Tax=Halyomorpha halys TaxID=286706 RepID=UPI000D0C7EA6|nr:uncharacterized protein LOC106688424 isoform X2 [Halyomorpha halys]